MRNRPLFLLALLLAIAAVAGCGSGGQGADRPPDDLSLEGPVSAEDDGGAPPAIPARYRCREWEVWLPLSWGEVPPGTEELAVTLLWSSIEEKDGETVSTPGELWIMGGINPRLRSLRLGSLPSGAFISKEHGASYPCPSVQETSGVSFHVFALPKAGYTRSLYVDEPTLEAFEWLEETSLASGSLDGIYGRTDLLDS